MKVAPGQALKHGCGLFLKNVRKTDLTLKDGLCPQCHKPVEEGDIGSVVQEFITWKLYPPHGMAFKNEMGSEVSIRFPRGQETILFQELQRQLNAYIQASLPKSSQGNGNGTATESQFMNSVRRGMSTRVIVSDDGEISYEEVDPTNPHASTSTSEKNP
jgi:hypothetical protein